MSFLLRVLFISIVVLVVVVVIKMILSGDAEALKKTIVERIRENGA